MNETEKNVRKATEIHIAKLYFLEKRSQEEIANQFFMSRSNVSRILNKCVKEGIVQTTINDPSTLYPRIAMRLQSKFGLDNVIIGKASPSAAPSPDSLTSLAVVFLNKVIGNNMLLGVTQGNILAEVAACYTNTNTIKADVIQMMGGTSPACTPASGTRIAVTLADKLCGEAYLLHAPLMVSNSKIKSALVSDFSIAPVIKKYSAIDVALMEISPLRVQLGPTFREPWLSKSDALQLKELRSVSMVSGHYFDESGFSCDDGISTKTLAIDTDLLREIPVSIGVACGEAMVAPTLSVIRSRTIRNLIIDTSIAYKLDNL